MQGILLSVGQAMQRYDEFAAKNMGGPGERSDICLSGHMSRVFAFILKATIDLIMGGDLRAHLSTLSQIQLQSIN